MLTKIGLEVHVQLATKTKLFCSCEIKQAAKPNSLTCPVCLGLPGAKPALNDRALRFAIKAALALNCKLNKKTWFSRKVYFYPDLSKNYQITQFDAPIGYDGWIKIDKQKIRIRRIHLEEDPAAVKYPKTLTESEYTLIDYNRSGVPLVEIVTEPQIKSLKQTKKFISKLLTILEFIGIFEPSKCTFRVDANISVENHERVEIKNIGGIKELQLALGYEQARQTAELMRGEKGRLQTRIWDSKTKTTILAREKEEEAEYGYIFEPDLPIYDLTKVQISLRELPDQRSKRFVKQYKITPAQAESLVSDFHLSKLFEKLATKFNPKILAIWLGGYLLKTLNYYKMRFNETKMTERYFEIFFELLTKDLVTKRGAELLLRELVLHPQNPKILAKRLNLLRLSDKEVEKYVQQVIKSNIKAAEDFRQGKIEVLDFLIGEVIKLSKGRADPKVIKRMLLSKLRR